MVRREKQKLDINVPCNEIFGQEIAVKTIMCQPNKADRSNEAHVCRSALSLSLSGALFFVNYLILLIQFVSIE